VGRTPLIEVAVKSGVGCGKKDVTFATVAGGGTPRCKKSRLLSGDFCLCGKEYKTSEHTRDSSCPEDGGGVRGNQGGRDSARRDTKSGSKRLLMVETEKVRKSNWGWQGSRDRKQAHRSDESRSCLEGMKERPTEGTKKG